MSGVKLWEKILRDSSQNKRYPEGNLILLGRKNSGSRHLISSLQNGPGSLGRNTIYTQLISPDDPVPISSPLNYSYINAKDISDPQSDKISKVNIYSLELPELKSLLEFAVSPRHLNNTLLGIVLDWEQPWRFAQDLEMWIDIWHEILGKIMSSLPLEEQDSLVKTVADYVKAYRDPDQVGESTVDLEDLPLPEGVLQVNLGVPVMVICCKSDLVWSIDKNRDQNERILDSALKTLREFCVTYGASLFYTSSRTGANVGAFYDYIMHRIYGFNLRHKSQILVRDQIFIPAGWDSPNLIKQTDYIGNEKQFHDLLPRPKNKNINKDEVALADDQEFLCQIKEKLESGRKSNRAGVSLMLQRPNPADIPQISAEIMIDSSSKGTQKTLQDFYKNLLNKGGKDIGEI